MANLSGPCVRITARRCSANGAVGFAPRNAFQRAVFLTEQGLIQTVGMAREAVPLPPLGAQHALADGMIRLGQDAGDAPALHGQIQVAPASAIAAGRQDFFHAPPRKLFS